MSQNTFFASDGAGRSPLPHTVPNKVRPVRENFMQIGLATSEEIRDWAERSYLLQGKYVEIGEVKKADTINYRTFKPEKDGLFCERIFGPVNDWVCGCGNEVRMGNSVGKPSWDAAARKATGPKTLGVNPSICPNCQVEFTLSRIRRYRMGYINLACKVTHIWYLNSRPNLFSVLLKMPTKYVKKITYYKGYTPSDPKLWNPCLGPGGDFFDTEWEFLHRWLGGVDSVGGGAGGLRAQASTKFLGNGADGSSGSFSGISFLRSPAWLENTGAEALQNYLAVRNWEKDVKQLEDELRRTPNLVDSTGDTSPNQMDFRLAVPFLLKRRKKRVRTLKLLNIFRAAGGVNCFRSSGLILNKIPVLPPELRPIVQLNAGQLASSDVNDLYRRVISRNNRLKYYLTGAGGRTTSSASPPVEFLVRSERHLVQLACDALLENGKTTNVRHSAGVRSGGAGRRGSTPLGPPYKSLSDRIGGKQGRFRQNLLGKRVDYSGRSVIVVGPKLKLYECGLPYEMATELFQAFLIRHIMELQLAKTIRGAKNLIRFNEPLTRQLLENVVFAHPILLNRAPTLHRLGIQAFQPKLVNGRGIQLHPLVCPAFNADFDGDQMAVHVPLSPSARIEARLLMLANTNWLSPATGQPSILPSQDMVLGFYYLSIEATSGRPRDANKISKHDREGDGRQSPRGETPEAPPRPSAFVNFADVLQSYEAPQSSLNLHSPVWVLRPGQQQPTCGPVNTTAPSHRKKLVNSSGGRGRGETPPPTFENNLVLGKSAFGRQGKNPDEPLHVRVSRSGLVRKLYTSYKWLEDSQERRRDFSIRTTPGRILVNQVLQDFCS